jgi:nitronate monooxygenase
MFLVSGPDLVLATCLSGVIGSFPAPNARTLEILDDWLGRITTGLAAAKNANPLRRIAPWAANIAVHRSYLRLRDELDLVVKYRAPLVITALGSPAPVVEAVHGYGGLVFADVNSVGFAAKAARTGVDGLILVSAGAGGHTGMVSSFAFVDAVRSFWDGILVVAGGVSNGRGIRAAQVLGADLAYMGTRFIATTESMATDDYRQMLVDSSLEDIVMTNAFTGVYANMLKPSIRRKGLDPDNLKPKDKIDFDDPQGAMKAWKDIWSAGQGVNSIKRVTPAAELIAELRQEYAQALAAERQPDPWADLAAEAEGVPPGPVPATA